MKVGIYSPYFETYGGGERYALSVAEFFLKRGDTVDIFSGGKLDRATAKERFGLDIDKAGIKNRLNTRGYDLFFAVSDGSIPFSWAKRNWLHFQVPFTYANQRTIANKIKLFRYAKIICNSGFTKKYIDKTYSVNSIVVYPPVDVAKFASGKKENIILSVGRFASPSHPKKQEVLARAFEEMKLPGWKLVLLGGGDAPTPAEHKNITIIANCDFATLRNYYSRASIYWHAAGYGEDLETFPDKAEHFGMSTVEAMAAGAVPVVFGAGGQKEIVEDSVSGFFWQTPKDLAIKTQALIKDKDLWRRMSAASQQRSKEFSKEKFFENLRKLL